MPWLDDAGQGGRWYDETVIPFDTTDRGLLLGDGVFDTALVLGGQMVWRRPHVDRLIASAKLLGFKVDVARVDAAIDAAIARMTYGSLRVTVTRGGGPRGLAPSPTAKPTVLAASAPLRAAVFFAPIKLQVSAIRRNETSPTSRIKSLNYLDGILANKAALDEGYDDALFLNTQGHVACTSVGNVFALVGDQLVTPPLDDGAVPGIVRSLLLDRCQTLGLERVERSLSLQDLDEVDEILVCNSLRLMAPVTMIGKTRPRSTRRSEALSAFLAHAIRDDVGIDPRTVAEL